MMKSKGIDPKFKEAGRLLVEAFDRAWNERDPEVLASMFTEEADFQFYYGLMVRGREKIKRYYREKVFPYLPKGLRHVTRSSKARQITDTVIIGDARVDLVDIQEENPGKAVQQRLKVTTVVVKEDGEWMFSAVRVMCPVKD
jgi:uncharacterized protein (TIGR02246 family)